MPDRWHDIPRCKYLAKNDARPGELRSMVGGAGMTTRRCAVGPSLSSVQCWEICDVVFRATAGRIKYAASVLLQDLINLCRHSQLCAAMLLVCVNSRPTTRQPPHSCARKMEDTSHFDVINSTIRCLVSEARLSSTIPALQHLTLSRRRSSWTTKHVLRQHCPLTNCSSVGRPKLTLVVHGFRGQTVAPISPR